MRKLSLFTTISIVMSTISAVVGILIFALFSLTTYYFLDQEIKTTLTSTATELTSNYFVLSNETIAYIHNDDQISITDLLKSRDLSAVILNANGERIGTFGLFRFIFDSQPDQTGQIIKVVSEIKNKDDVVFSHLEINDNTYELYTIPLHQNGNIYGYLQLAKQYTFLKNLRSLTTMLFFFAVPPVILIVWFLSRSILEKFLRPLETLVKLFSSFSVNTLPKKLKTESSFVEMHSLVDACNTMIDRLGSGIERQKHFTAYASHELNTPLTRAVGYLDRALITDIQKDVQINKSIQELESVSELLQGLLLLLQPNQLNKTKKGVNLLKVIRKIEEKFSPELIRKNIEFIVNCNADINVAMEKTHLFMMLQNLVSNSIKYTNSGGKIKITVSVDGKFAQIEVDDTGIGITDEQKNKIFKPFFRTSQVSFIPGVGIGLSLVKQIVAVYELEIKLESKEGVGTKIVVGRIPVV